MEFLTSRDLRLNPKQVWKRLRKDRFGVVMLNGKPRFLVSPIDASVLEKALYLFNRLRAEIAVEDMQRTSKLKKLDKMSSAEIDKVIRRARGKK